MMRKFIVFLLIIFIFALPTSAYAAKSYTARSYNVDIYVQPGGSLQVSETAIFRFSGGPFTYVFRTIQRDYVDGITNIHAFMDGQELPLGTAPGQVEIQEDNPIRITWHFIALSDTTHTFVLQYTALNAIGRSGAFDQLDWNALPTDHDYPIKSSRVRVAYPPAVSLTGQPAVTRGEASIARAPNEVIYRAENIKPNDPLTISLHFPENSLITTLPTWQRRQVLTDDTINQMMPF